MIRSLNALMRSPSAPYVIPFAVFLALLGLHTVVPSPELVDQWIRLVVMTAVLLAVSRSVLDFRIQRWAASIFLGVAVFVIWIAPDVLFPNYRHSWLFENSITGAAQTTLSATSQMQTIIVVLRTMRSILIVPIIEELFWRAWLMRWLISAHFRKIPLGAYTPFSFWIVAVLFATEHGSYWDVGLVTGVIYNWWMIRTKSLGDLILTHAVTNACLSAYIIGARKWEYWL